MSRQRQEREARALRLLRQRPKATAIEIGTAALRGDGCVCKIPRDGREAIGLSIAASLVRRGLTRPTRENAFAATVRIKATR